MYTKEDEIAINQLALSLIKIINSKEINKEMIDDIKKVIHYADWKYYVQDQPTIADQEYDILFSTLKNIEAENPTLLTPDSPTQRIAKGISKTFDTVQHLVPMLSLENSYNAEDLLEFDRKCKEFAKKQTIEYTVEPKYDGAGISVLFENDYLQRGATRGDGIQGENITINTKQIKTIPLKAAFSTENVDNIEIRGEVIIRKENFKAINEKRISEGLSIMANPRNAASGSLRMLDAAEVGKRGLIAILYHVSYHTNHQNVADSPRIATHYDSIKWLSELGFATPINDMLKTSDINDVINFCAQYEQNRDALPFEIDGMVIKVNHLEDQETMGQTTHHPRWAIAYKFKARQATSKLLKVEYQVGRTGNIGPVAKIDPVHIGGVTVSSVSLFNEDVIKEKDLMINDTVLVERAGDVIPYIVKSLPELRDGSQTPIIFPKTCPICDEALVKIEGEAAVRCVNMNCDAQVVERLIHFGSKDAMDIRNLGEANVRKFFDMGIVKSIEDIYTLDFEPLGKIEKFGAKSVENLQLAIEKSKSQPLNRLIYGLGIRFVGENTAKILAKSVHHLKDFETWTAEQFCMLEDVGPKVANAVVTFFQNHENIHLIDTLERLGLNVVNNAKNEVIVDGSLSEKSFLFTGSLTKFKRNEAEAKVEALGGKILGSVSSKLNYLVVGADAGSKLEKAKKLGTVSVLTEDEFLKLLEN